MSAAGQEQELRVLFAQEAEQRLARLDRELLELERVGGGDELISSIFRDAHTLKGSAAVVGLDDVARVAHAMESLLEQVRTGTREATSGLIDALLAAADGLREMIPAAIRGDDRSSSADALERRLLAATTEDPAPPPLLVEPPPTAIAEARRREQDAMLVPVRRLDKLVRLVGESEAARLRLGRTLAAEAGLDPEKSTEFRDLSLVLTELQKSTIRTRMVPISTITDHLQRAVRDLSHSLGKSVRWEVAGADTELDRSVLQQLADPLLHLVRNAVDHGLETPDERRAAGKPAQGMLALHAVQAGSEVIVTLTDDGRGIDVDRVRAQAERQGTRTADLSDEEALYLVFESGVSTARRVSDVSGRGVGLDAVRAGVEAVRGRITVQARPGEGTEFRIVVPITLAVMSCLVVGIDDERYALPMHSVAVVQSASDQAAASAGGRPLVWAEESPIMVSSLAATLWGDGRGRGGEVVVVVGDRPRHAFLVDTLLGQRNVVVKGLSPLLRASGLFAGASVEPDGTILLVLDASGLIKRARSARAGAVPAEPVDAAGDATPDSEPRPRGTILVVDDAAIVRQLQRSILERAGYAVHTAVDGADALERLSVTRFDMVLTDIEMPRVDGFQLTEAIRADPDLSSLPVLIITSRSSDSDHQRGLDAGADGYVVKTAFDEASLLDAIERFLGDR